MVKQFLKGRLGNVMFEIATAYAYALDHNMPFTISNTTKDPVMQPLYFQNLVNPNWNERKPAKFIREMQHNYQPLPWEDDWKNYNIQMMGFWQSEKYFKHRETEIRQLFNIRYHPYMNHYVSIHVRRGDYLIIPGKHIHNTDEYMDRAIEHFKGRQFAVFSDDMDWCRQYFSNKFPDESFRFEGSDDPLEDMARMSSCRHFINSSSTFAWWAAWLGSDTRKTVLTPKEWFQSTQSEDTSDIIPENWIKI